MDVHDIVMTNESEVKSKTKVETKGDTQKDLEGAGDKIKAGAKAVASKIKNTNRNLGTEYEIEKIKENVD
jgi:hypothetical protein